MVAVETDHTVDVVAIMGDYEGAATVRVSLDLMSLRALIAALELAQQVLEGQS